MKKFFCLMIVSLFLFGCDKTQTPEQLYFELEQDYNVVLEAAVQYKNYCYQEKKTKTCYDTVQQIRGKRDVIEAAIREADNDLTINDYKDLDVKLTIMKATLAELSMLTEKDEQ